MIIIILSRADGQTFGVGNPLQLMVRPDRALGHPLVHLRLLAVNISSPARPRETGKSTICADAIETARTTFRSHGKRCEEL